MRVSVFRVNKRVRYASARTTQACLGLLCSFWLGLESSPVFGYLPLVTNNLLLGLGKCQHFRVARTLLILTICVTCVRVSVFGPLEFPEFLSKPSFDRCIGTSDR